MYIETIGIIVLILLGLFLFSIIIDRVEKWELKKGGYYKYPNFMLSTYLWGSPNISKKTDDLHGVITDDYLIILKPEAFEGVKELDKIDLQTIKEVKIEEVNSRLRLIIVCSEVGVENSVVFEFPYYNKEKAIIAQSQILYHIKNTF
jgi:hypothetical protein